MKSSNVESIWCVKSSAPGPGPLTLKDQDGHGRLVQAGRVHGPVRSVHPGSWTGLLQDTSTHCRCVKVWRRPRALRAPRWRAVQLYSDVLLHLLHLLPNWTRLLFDVMGQWVQLWKADTEKIKYYSWRWHWPSFQFDPPFHFTRHGVRVTFCTSAAQIHTKPLTFNYPRVLTSSKLWSVCFFMKNQNHWNLLENCSFSGNKVQGWRKCSWTVCVCVRVWVHSFCAERLWTVRTSHASRLPWQRVQRVLSCEGLVGPLFKTVVN